MLWTLIGVALVAGIAGAVAWPHIRARRDAQRLHRQYASANELSAAETEWLWRVANRPEVTDPLLVFVTPSLLEGVSDSDSAQAKAVRQKLFS